MLHAGIPHMHPQGLFPYMACMEICAKLSRTCMIATVTCSPTEAMQSSSCRNGNAIVFQSANMDAHTRGINPARSPLEPTTFAAKLDPVS